MDVCVCILLNKLNLIENPSLSFSFIHFPGIGHEGIFRVNGSTRVVDNLRSQYDRNGDANLEQAEDVMAVAGLLKMFFRELPDPVMTEYLHQSFISVQEGWYYKLKIAINSYVQWDCYGEPLCNGISL